MEIQSIFENVVEVANMSPIEVTVWLVVLALFVWLYKEFRAQYQENKKLKTIKNDKLLIEISKALSIAYRYQSDKATSDEFFNTIFKCFPYWNSDEIKNVKIILYDKSKDENKKINKISNLLYEQLDSLNNQNKDFSSIRTGIGAIEYVILNKLKEILLPIIQAFSTLFIALLIFIYFLDDTNFYIKLLKFGALLSLVLLSFVVIDDYITKKMKNNKCIIFISITYITLISLTIVNNLIAIIVFFLTLIVSFVSYYKFRF